MSNSLVQNTTALMLDGSGNQTEKYIMLSEKMKDYTDELVILTSNPLYENSFNYQINSKCKLIYFKNFLNYQEFAQFTIFEFYKVIKTKFYMTYHLDGYIVNPSKWNPEFLNYDWISAPWPHELNYPWVRQDRQVGNGGFSIRSTEMMKAVAAIANHINYNGCIGEDVFICAHLADCLEKTGFKFAPTDLAKQFAVENPLDCGRDCGHYITNTFGFHGKQWIPELQNLNYWTP